MKSVLQIPASSGNHIFLIGVDLEKKKLWYRKGFNPKQEIEEDYEVFGDQVRTALINFHINWLSRFQELMSDQIKLRNGIQSE